MKRVAIMFLFIIIALVSCDKLDIEAGTPKCIESKIKSFNKTSICDNAEVTEHIFQGKTVYVFSPGNTCGADMTSEVIDSNCNSLGYLGGDSGITKINGEEFSNAAFIKTIWKK